MRIKRLVCAVITKHGVAMNTRFVDKNPIAYHRLGRGDVMPGFPGYQAAKREKGFGIHPATQYGMLMQRHNDLLKGNVTGTFAKAVDRHADGMGAGFESAYCIGGGHAEIVVAVEFKTQFRNNRFDGRDKLGDGTGTSDAHGIGHTHTKGTGSLCPGGETVQKCNFSTGCILSAYRYVVKMVTRHAYKSIHSGQHPIIIFAQGVQMYGRHGKAYVNTGDVAARGGSKIIFVGTTPDGQSTAEISCRNAPDIFLNLRSHNRNAYLQFIDSSLRKGFGNGDFGRTFERDAGCLLAIAQGGVYDTGSSSK
jgi:hypothetical protein